jgi:hypothetical protein
VKLVRPAASSHSQKLNPDSRHYAVVLVQIFISSTLSPVFERVYVGRALSAGDHWPTATGDGEDCGATRPARPLFDVHGRAEKLYGKPDAGPSHVLSSRTRE